MYDKVTLSNRSGSTLELQWNHAPTYGGAILTAPLNGWYGMPDVKKEAVERVSAHGSVLPTTQYLDARYVEFQISIPVDSLKMLYRVLSGRLTLTVQEEMITSDVRRDVTIFRNAATGRLQEYLVSDGDQPTGADYDEWVGEGKRFSEVTAKIIGESYSAEAVLSKGSMSTSVTKNNRLEIKFVLVCDTFKEKRFLAETEYGERLSIYGSSWKSMQILPSIEGAKSVGALLNPMLDSVEGVKGSSELPATLSFNRTSGVGVNNSDVSTPGIINGDVTKATELVITISNVQYSYKIIDPGHFSINTGIMQAVNSRVPTRWPMVEPGQVYVSILNSTNITRLSLGWYELYL